MKDYQGTLHMSKDTIKHNNHKICNNKFFKLKKREKIYKLCPNCWDVDYKIHCKPILNLWKFRGFIIKTDKINVIYF